MDYKDIVLRDIKREVLLDFLRDGRRGDGRELYTYREVSIENNPIDTAEGSAIAQIGDTRVLVATKFDIVTPFPDRPDEGSFSFSAEFLPLASPKFEPGPPGEDAIELARVVDRGIRSAEIIDTKKFFIEEGKALGLFFDIYILNASGNLFDCASLAALAALKNTKIPKVENGEIIRNESVGGFDIPRNPVLTTFVKIGEFWMADPNKDEDLAHDSRITIGTTEEHLCSIQKGRGKLSMNELDMLIDKAFELGKFLRTFL